VSCEEETGETKQGDNSMRWVVGRPADTPTHVL